jgi:hypothetical protein
MFPASLPEQVPRFSCYTHKVSLFSVYQLAQWHSIVQLVQYFLLYLVERVRVDFIQPKSKPKLSWYARALCEQAGLPGVHEYDCCSQSNAWYIKFGFAPNACPVHYSLETRHNTVHREWSRPPVLPSISPAIRWFAPCTQNQPHGHDPFAEKRAPRPCNGGSVTYDTREQWTTHPICLEP